VLVLVEVQQRPGLGVVDLDAVPDHVFAVVDAAILLRAVEQARDELGFVARAVLSGGALRA
jgi:DNA primase